MADDVVDGSRLPDDVLVQILSPIPATSRRPLGVVCKGWRNVIDERTSPEEKLPSKILVFVNQGHSSSAIVFDNASSLRTHNWTYTSSSDGGSVHMVGTCNGLLCLHDHSTYGGFSFSSIRVTNPITGETVALPLVPERWAFGQFVKPPGKYNFGFHRATKRHKVVYIPNGQRQSVDALQVFTLGDGKAWREVPVPTPGACYDLQCEPVSVGGSTYWIAKSSNQVMALDLGDERVTSPDVPSAMVPAAQVIKSEVAAGRATWRLTKVNESLGVVVSLEASVRAVWVLDDGEGEEPEWSRRYTVVAGNLYSGEWVMAPQLTHGDYILSEWLDDPEDGECTARWLREGASHLYRHEVGVLTDGGARIRPLLSQKKAPLIMSKEERKGQFSRLLPTSRLEIRCQGAAASDEQVSSARRAG